MSADYLTVKEIATRWRVSEMTVYRLIDVGRLGATRVGRQVRITEEDYDRYLADNKAAPDVAVPS